MKAVFSGAQLGHSPSRFLSLGNIVDYPESPERARRLLEGARQAGSQILAARRFSEDTLSTVHLQAYLTFLRSAFEEWEQIAGAGPELMPSLRPVTRPFLRSKHILGRAGMYLMDFSCPITQDTWKSASASAMTALTAADLVLKGEKVSYALCRPPGHHAYANRAGGFCYLNNGALAAEQLRKALDRIAILDIDVHHGNGTQAIFYDRADILTVSIHADPAVFYPFYWGGAEETGSDEGEGYNLNLPLPLGAGNDQWLAALDTALERIEKFAAGALVIALGLDSHEADPLKGGTVTTGGFAKIAGQVAGLGLPTIIIQEGGYLTDHLADNLAMFLTSYEGALERSVEGASVLAAPR
jgi:acetoin utilization deacetylase AcuC-like enzyme